MEKYKFNPIWYPERGQWMLNVQRDGIRKQFTSTKTGRAGSSECKKKAMNWVDNRQDKSETRLDKAWEEYLAYCEPMVDIDTYIQREKYGRLYITSILPNKKMGQYTDQDWQNLIAHAAGKTSERTGRKLSRKTLMNIRSVIVNFCSFAKRSNMIASVPEITIPKSAKFLPKVIMQPNDVIGLFTAPEEWWIHLWRFRVVMGYRPSEALGFKWSDINSGYIMMNRAITIHNTLSDGKTDSAQRLVKLPKIAVFILLQQRAMLEKAGVKSEWVFPKRDGNPPKQNGVKSAWDKYRARNDVNCSLYKMRHTFVSLMKSELPLPLLRAMIGHTEEMDTIGTYGTGVTGDKEKTAEIIDQVFEKMLCTQFVHTLEDFSHDTMYRELNPND